MEVTLRSRLRSSKLRAKDRRLTREAANFKGDPQVYPGIQRWCPANSVCGLAMSLLQYTGPISSHNADGSSMASPLRINLGHNL